MLVSVLMPTFNVAQYVAAAVNSILGQTWRDLELLVQDDGSSDGTVDVVQNIARSDGRVRVLPPFRENSGVVAARNALLKSAQGDFIAWMDSDDVSLPPRLQTQLDFLARNPEFGALGTAIQWMDSDGTAREIQRFSPDPAKQAIDPNVCCASVMARRVAVEDAGPFREAFFAGSEDRDWLLKMADRHKITNIADVLYAYRRHSGLMSRNRGVIARLGVLARYAARLRRRGEPDPIETLVPDRGFHFLRDAVFLDNPEFDNRDVVEALGRPLPGENPLVSVLIPCCDEEPYFFEKHMREWSSQTFRNFEVLIHDDASRTAVEEERVRKLLPEIPLTVVRSETRNGSAAARAALLARARGSILAWQNEDVEEVEALLPANSTSKTRRTLFLEALVHARLNTIRRAKPAQ